MALSISLYNHTPKLFASGAAQGALGFRVILCTSATFDAAHTEIDQVSFTEVVSGNGYQAGGKTLSGVTYTDFGTSGAKVNASDLVWIANGGSISADYAIIRSDSAPLVDAAPYTYAFIDFGGTETAANGNEFRIEWNSGGIFTFVAA